jgi:hypothetical protein
LNISNDDELGASKDETSKGPISGLNCKVWVQFESYDDFHNAMKALCGRSLEKVKLAYLLLVLSELSTPIGTNKHNTIT